MVLTRRLVVLSLVSAALVTACRKKPEVQPAPAATPPAQGSTPSAPPAATPTAPASTPAPSGPTPAAIAAARATLEGAVYFEYDQDGLTDRARTALDSKLAILLANTQVQIRVTGHADERGSDEYNLALGQRRAASIRRYFADRGVTDSRVSIVSVGEEQPECTTAEEGCWERNRRATFEITSGAITNPPSR